MSAPRYLYVSKHKLLEKIFEKEFINVDSIIPYDKEEELDSKIKMPLYLVPLVPIILINGCIGVATGYSTKIA